MAALGPRRAYDTDRNDSEGEIYQEVFPEHIGISGVSEAKYSVREIIHALRYRERTGCQWRNLPHDFPPWKTISYWFYTWRKQGRFATLRELVMMRRREQEGRASTPTAGVIDSQSVKTTEVGGPKGLDNGKKIKGRKRPLLVDVLGLVLLVLVTPASVQDRDGGAMLLGMASKKYPTLQRVWVDGAYNGAQLDEASRTTGIAGERREKSENQKGFVPIKTRWGVERTFGWLNRARRLSKDYERTLASSQGWIDISLTRIASAALCRDTPRSRIFSS